MSHNPNYQHQRKSSAHQKQIRFFTVLFGILDIRLIFAIMWLIKRIR